MLDTPVRWRLARQIEPAGALGSGELSWRLSNGRAIVGNSEVLTGSCRGLVHEQGLRLRKLAAKAREHREAIAVEVAPIIELF